MKIILTGSTGTIGSEVLSQALSHPSITSLIILSRRPLSLPLPSKAKVIILSQAEFISYPPSILKELEGAEACIWALGGLPNKYPTLEIARQVNIDYPVSAAHAFVENLVPRLARENKRFRFWYVSGKAVERDLEKPLWVLQDARRIKGEIETKLLEAQDTSFSLHFARVGSVIPMNNLGMKLLGAITNPFYPAISVGILAAGMVDAAVRGTGKTIVEHEELKRMGEDALSNQLPCVNL